MYSRETHKKSSLHSGFVIINSIIEYHRLARIVNYTNNNRVVSISVKLLCFANYCVEVSLNVGKKVEIFLPLYSQRRFP